MSVENISQGSSDVKVENLDPNSRRVNLHVKVVSKSESREIVSRMDGSTHKVADALVGDDTGCLYFTVWDDDIEKLNEEDVLKINNAYITLFKGSMRLSIGRYGSFEKSEESVENVNTENNLSDKEYEQPRRRYSRSSQRSGYGGGRRPYRNRSY
jgi:replication factor A1